MQLERTVDAAASPEAVFAYLSDFTTTTEWDPGTVETVRLSGDGGEGTKYRNTSEFRGRRTELIYEVVQYEPDASPRRFALRGENRTLASYDAMVIAAHGQGTRVSYTADFRFKGPARLAVPFLGKALQRLGDEAAAGMLEALARL